jgi:hypothetical protein
VEIVNATDALSFLLRFAQHGQKHRRQDPDDRDYHEQFYQREPRQFSLFHIFK